MTQQEQVLLFIFKYPGQKVSTNHLRTFGYDNYMADPEKRARELYKDKMLERRWATPEELSSWQFKTDIMVYEITIVGRLTAQGFLLKQEFETAGATCRS